MLLIHWLLLLLLLPHLLLHLGHRTIIHIHRLLLGNLIYLPLLGLGLVVLLILGLVTWLLNLHWHRLLALSHVLGWLVAVIRELVVALIAISLLHRHSLLLLQFLWTMRKGTFDHVRTIALLEVFAKFSLVVASVLRLNKWLLTIHILLRPILVVAAIELAEGRLLATPVVALHATIVALKVSTTRLSNITLTPSVVAEVISTSTPTLIHRAASHVLVLNIILISIRCERLVNVVLDLSTSVKILKIILILQWSPTILVASLILHAIWNTATTSVSTTSTAAETIALCITTVDRLL